MRCDVIENFRIIKFLWFSYSQIFSILVGLAIEYTDCTSCKGLPPVTDVLDTILKHRMVRLQSDSFREYGVPFIAITRRSSVPKSSTC